MIEKDEISNWANQVELHVLMSWTIDIFRIASYSISGDYARDRNLRAVFSGQWLRDFETMAAVVAIADHLNLPVYFEMIVPRQSRGQEACYKMAMSSRVRWYSDLTDEDLRRSSKSFKVTSTKEPSLPSAVDPPELMRKMSCHGGGSPASTLGHSRA